MSETKEQEAADTTEAQASAPAEDANAAEPATNPSAAEPAADANAAEPAAPAAGEGSDEPVAEEPRKKKKKKKRKPEQEQEAEAESPPAIVRPERDADGRDRPRFLLSFPQDPQLEALMSAFEVGDFAAVRADAPRLIERTERPEVKRAAEELLRRIEPDPLVKFLLGVAVFLFVAVVAYVYYIHG